MSSVYNNINDIGSSDKEANIPGNDTTFLYGDLQERVQVVNAKSINSNTAYVSVNENNAVRVDVKRVPNQFEVIDATSGESVKFDGSHAIELILPANITSIAYKVYNSTTDLPPYPGIINGEHYLDFTYSLVEPYLYHIYVSLKPMQNLISAEAQARAEADNILDGKISAEELRAKGVEGGLATDIGTINSKIPDVASSGNKLADKNFVNSSIQNMAAFYVTYDAQGNPFPTKTLLASTSTVYIDGVAAPKVGHNDYCIVVADESKGTVVSGYTSFITTTQYVGYRIIHNNVDTLVTNDNKNSLGIVPGTTICYETIPTTRYIYTGDIEESYDSTKWAFQYIINNSGLTSDQLAAVNSGITAPLVEQFKGYNTSKQDKLVDNISVEVDPSLEGQQNLKTINGETILGPGNLNVSGAPSYADADNNDVLSVNVTPAVWECETPIEEDTTAIAGIWAHKDNIDLSLIANEAPNYYDILNATVAISYNRDGAPKDAFIVVGKLILGSNYTLLVLFGDEIPMQNPAFLYGEGTPPSGSSYPEGWNSTYYNASDDIADILIPIKNLAGGAISNITVTLVDYLDTNWSSWMGASDVFIRQEASKSLEWTPRALSKEIVDIGVPQSSAAPESLLGITDGSTKVSKFDSTVLKTWLGVGSATGTFTKYSSDWSLNNDVYTATATISGLTNTDTLLITPADITSAQNSQEANVYFGSTSETTLTLYASAQPTGTIVYSYTIIK